jgi:exonuclease III
MLKNTLIAVFIFSTGIASAQDNFDIIKMMHYNILNYRNTTTWCDGNSNPPADKDAHLKTILNHVKPDIVTLNEIGSNPVNASRLLSNAFVVDGMDYDFGNFSNQASSSLVNMMFYNKNKLVLYKHVGISKGLNLGLLVRDIDVYTLYYKDPIALAANDTVFFNVAVAHLKASSTQADKDERARQTEALMDYINTTKTSSQNWIFSGDFNVQSSSETSFQNLINHSNEAIRFYDPADAIGSWTNNSSFVNVHTQSTRSSATSGGCFSSGGMDDRFDFILCNKEILDNKLHLNYIKNSYKALGQDGKRFNSTINSPTNTSAPQPVIDALYGLSDHLPVLMDMSARKWVAGVKNINNQVSIVMPNPANNDWFIEVLGNQLAPLDIEIIGLNGQIKHQFVTEGTALKQYAKQDLSVLSSGIYQIIIAQEGRIISTKRLFIQ